MTQKEKKELIQFINEIHIESITNQKNKSLKLFFQDLKKELEWHENYYKNALDEKRKGTAIDLIYKAKLQLTTDMLDYIEYIYGIYKNE